MTIEYKDSKRIVKLSTDAVETLTYGTTFSGSASHTTDNTTVQGWLASDADKLGVNGTTNMIDWDIERDSTDAISYDLGNNVHASKWILRYKIRWDAFSSSSKNEQRIGLSNLDSTNGHNATHNYLGSFYYYKDNSNRTFFGVYVQGGAIPAETTNAGWTNGSYDNEGSPTDTWRYIEVKRTSTTTFEVSMSSTDAYTKDVYDSGTNYTCDNITGLRYIYMVNESVPTGGTANMNCNIGDIKFYNGVTTVTSKPTDVPDNSILVEKDTAKRFWFDENKISTTGLKAYYNFDATTGNYVNKASTVGSSDGITADMTTVSATRTNTGILGKAVDFNGSSEYVLANGSASDWSFLFNEKMSVSFWLNNQMGATSGGHTLFSTSTAEGGGGFYMDVTTSSGMRVIWQGSSFSNDTYALTSIVDSSTGWHHFVVTYNNGTTTVYKDGSSFGSSTSYSNHQGYGSDTQNVMIVGCNHTNSGGRNYYTEFMIDEMAFWGDRVLTSDEVSALYNSGTGAIMSEAKSPTWTLGGFQPTDISSLAHWYDASDLDSITKDSSTNRVSQWNDKKGSDNLTASSGNEPLWTDADQNSKAVIDFVSSKWVSNSASSVAQPNTYFLALTAPDGSGSSTVRPFTSGGQQVFKSGASNRWQLYAGSQPNFTSDIGTAFQIWEITFNGSSSYWKVNNVSKMSSVNTGTGTAGALELGRGSGGDVANNKVGEFIRYDGTLTDAQKTSVYNYLKKKWGL